MSAHYYVAYPTGQPPTPHRSDDETQRVMLFDTRNEARLFADSLAILCDVYPVTPDVRRLIAEEERSASPLADLRFDPSAVLLTDGTYDRAERPQQ